ncbi:MAG: exopolysaccharide biosynthesis polyprenyl glycosylphosphotransferase [Verrucomicrobiaceae bacterium]|nr:exopolysaccharide biosynthesis polyprenyl glycosylphosphotransferase [Verrucomicrobiaceae bacterium]
MDFKPLHLKTVFPAPLAQRTNRISTHAWSKQVAVPAAAPQLNGRVAHHDTEPVVQEPRTTAKRAPHTWVYAAIAGDWFVAVLASVAAFWIRFNTAMRDVGVFESQTLEQYGGHVALGSITLVAVLAKQGIYNRAALLRSRWVADKISVGVLVWTAGFLAVTLAFKIQPPISRIYMALNGACALILLIGWRRVYDAFLRSGSRIASLRQRAIFVGWNDDADHFAKSLRKDEACAFDVLGWVDTDGKAAASGAPGTSVPRLGSLAEMEQILVRHRADMVVLADLGGPRDQIVELSNLCERELVNFKVIPSCFRIFVSGLHLETVAGTPILGVDRLPLDSSLNVAVKRALDIAGALFGMVVFSPVIALFTALVRLESPGAVFYRQRRTGIDGRTFDIIKIRSMKLDAEQGTGATWCVKDDPRRLRVGAFMRKWNIDELPQFWNVLKGDMSLVGPRPERPELIKNFKHEIPHYQARHNAKPGMTGWAQVKGWRGDTDLGERIKCDLWYLENWSVILDLQIMFLTLFRRDNAY